MNANLDAQHALETALAAIDAATAHDYDHDVQMIASLATDLAEKAFRNFGFVPGAQPTATDQRRTRFIVKWLELAVDAAREVEIGDHQPDLTH